MLPFLKEIMSVPNQSQSVTGEILSGPRSTRGFMPSQSSLYDSPADVKKAKKLRWVFYKKYDPCPFDIAYNDSAWPKMSLIDKLTMEKNTKVNFKSTDCGRFRASFVERVPVDDIDHFTIGVTQKVASADKSFSDISSVG